MQPIGMVASGGAVIVAHPSAGISNLADLIAQAKANPGKLAYGSSGVGGGMHLAAELFQAATGIKLHHIPYKGGGPAMADLLGGQIPLLFSSMPPAVPMIKAGRIKAIGVTSAARTAFLPDVPTVAEQGFPGAEAEFWFAVVAPAGLPAAVSKKLGTAVTAAVSDPAAQSQIRTTGTEPRLEGPEETAARIRKDSAKWLKVIKDTRISLE